jgi:predicted metal-binding membrane protein
MRRSDPIAITTLVLGLALLAWIVTLERMRGMDAGPGTELGSLGWYLGLWVTMMAAMMLPSAAPTALLFGHVSEARGIVFFLSGYLAAWTTYGLVAFGLDRAARSFASDFLAWNEHGAVVAGGVIVAAGAYQLTPLKRACLRHCQSPLHYLRRHWREGAGGALRMGLGHGLFCVGCCSGLMLILFALGAMSLLWMTLVAALIFAEKVLPFGARLPGMVAISFLFLGAWVAVAPGTVPGLTEPGAKPAMHLHHADRSR